MVECMVWFHKHWFECFWNVGQNSYRWSLVVKKESMMMKSKNIVCLNIFLLIQSCFVFSHENLCNNNSKTSNTPNVEMHVNQNAHSSYNWYFSTQIREVPNYSNMQRVHYPVVAHGSPELQHYFHHTITAHMYDENSAAAQVIHEQ